MADVAQCCMRLRCVRMFVAREKEGPWPQKYTKGEALGVARALGPHEVRDRQMIEE
jgi:hypothetical protein